VLIYTIQQTSSKLPANVQHWHVYFEYICWKFAGRLLDRVNTPLVIPSASRGDPLCLGYKSGSEGTGWSVDLRVSCNPH